jgi:hypothetical protein
LALLAQRTIKSERFEREKLRQHIDFRATYRRQLIPTDRRLLWRKATTRPY